MNYDLKYDTIMLPEIDTKLVDDIVEYLSPLAKNEKLQDYSFKSSYLGIEEHSTISGEELNFLNDSTNTDFGKLEKFRTLIVRDLLDYYQNNRGRFFALSEWIVSRWGGIKTGDKEKFRKHLLSFIEKGEKRFKRISSTSKILFFLEPCEYVIYDSRGVYALNWILLNSPNADKYFPIPEGKNSKMNAFDIGTLIRAKHIDMYMQSFKDLDSVAKADEQLFYKKDESYTIFNELLIKVNEKLWHSDNDKKNDHFYTQTLLFIIADTLVFDEIKEGMKNVFF